jgi:hypothetical protein
LASKCAVSASLSLWQVVAGSLDVLSQAGKEDVFVAAAARGAHKPAEPARDPPRAPPFGLVHQQG